MAPSPYSAAALALDPDDVDDLDEEDIDDDMAKSDDATTEPDAGMDSERSKRRSGQRGVDLALATGYLLKARADGWKLFCERMGVPPFAVWELLPGYKRLRFAMNLAKGTPELPGPAFLPEGMIVWLNEIRPAGEPEVRELTATPEYYADAFEKVYRERAASWSGR
jgi:hypothetical protein